MRQVPAKLASKLYGAAELIAERGLADAKVDEIADAAGIPKATLYYYFSGKDEVLAFLGSEAARPYAHRILALEVSPESAAMSSTEARTSAEREGVPAAVEAYIRRHGLY